MNTDDKNFENIDTVFSPDNDTAQVMTDPEPSDTDTTAELPKPVDPDELPESDETPDTIFTKIRRHPAVTAGIGIAIVAVLGIGIAFAMPAKSTSSMAKPVKEPISQVASKHAAKHKVAVTLEADGWKDGDGKFAFALVDADGKEASKGDIEPGQAQSVKLEDGAYALNVTSIPTAADGKTTWVVPEAVSFTVTGRDAKVEVKLAKVDMTDDAAVAAAIEKLPEAEKKAAQELIAAKKENPNATAVSAPVAKPSAAAVKKAEAASPATSAKPASGSTSSKGNTGSASKPSNSSKPSSSSSNKSDGGSSKPSSSNRSDSGSSKPSSGSSSSKKDDSKPSSGNSGNSGSNSGNSGSASGSNSGNNTGNSGSTKPAEPERVWAVVTPAWDEQVYHPAVTHTEQRDVKVGVHFMADDGTFFDDEDDCIYYTIFNGQSYSVLPKYETQTVTVTDQEAWTETIHHDAVYGWVEK